VDDLTRAAVAAAAGDRLALATFVRQGQVPVWRLAAHLVDRDSADDLTQETMLRAVPALVGFRAESSATTWLLGIARRVCADEIRRRARRRRLWDRLVEQRPTMHTDAEDGAVDLDTLLAGLAPDRRAAFVLTQLLGLGYADAAEVCGCPVGTIRSRVARARADLIDVLRPAVAQPVEPPQEDPPDERRSAR
jgi:RNA polymerase sigma-70 factor (ECF subfamily)